MSRCAPGALTGLIFLVLLGLKPFRPDRTHPLSIQVHVIVVPGRCRSGPKVWMSPTSRFLRLTSSGDSLMPDISPLQPFPCPVSGISLSRSDHTPCLAVLLFRVSLPRDAPPDCRAIWRDGREATLCVRRRRRGGGHTGYPASGRGQDATGRSGRAQGGSRRHNRHM